jgi:hypothetical protein
MCILNTSECNILENLPPNEYEECINLLRELILGEFCLWKALLEQTCS